MLRAILIATYGAVASGQTARVHIVFRVDSSAAKLHWNNEAEPLRVWLDPPDDWSVSERFLTSALPARPVSNEERCVEFEVKVPATASLKRSITGYAVFHVCDDSGGTCRFARLDVRVEVPVRR